MGNKDVEVRGIPLKVTVSVGGKTDEAATRQVNTNNTIDRLMEEGEAKVKGLSARSQRGKLKSKSTTRGAREGNPKTKSEGPERKAPGTRGMNDWN